MLKTFSRNKPASLTIQAFYTSDVNGSESTALVQTKRLPLKTASINDIRKSSSSNYLDAIWKKWKDDHEDFDDFVDRIQTWPASNEGNLDLVCLINPNDPKYCFPQFVSILCSSLDGYTDKLYPVSKSLYSIQH
jgi:hypothetical protein